MKKLFVSLPMKGYTEEEVLRKMDDTCNIVNSMLADEGELYELIDSYHKEDAPVEGDAAGVWYLGDSIKLMAEADAVAFVPGWATAHGCRMEHQICEAYGFRILYVCLKEVN